MSEKNSNKSKLHPRNKHQGHYDFDAMIEAYPELEPYVKANKYGNDSIDFANPKAVKALNTSLLKLYYQLEKWDIPTDYLCPPIPGRADYIHYIAEFLGSRNGGIIPEGEKITCLDVGVGSNCIYPIIGVHEYDWNFIGSEIDLVAMESAARIRILNKSLKNKIEIRHQDSSRDIFHGIIKENECIDISICNPPFHASIKEAQEGTKRKLKNLGLPTTGDNLLNFGGKPNELTCEGGEVRFIRNMIHQSKRYANSCMWFSTIVSKKEHLKDIYKTLRQANTEAFTTILMAQGNKTTRVIAWTFLSEEDRKDWMEQRWN